ncbi:MAG: flagellar biosynthetic protein FliO [Phycisphaerales bacterium]|nr:flagellar biosynthetic protein FliO [Phycisphaerales bacterium]
MGIARLRFIILVSGLFTSLAEGADSSVPPSSEVNGVATIAEVPPPEPEVAPELILEPAPEEPEVVTSPEPAPPIVEAGSPASAMDSIGVVEDVLGDAGAASSFDRRPIFGGASDVEVANGENGTVVPTVSTAWWNAPELRVFGLLSVLVLAAVLMRRFGGRAVGLAGGPRPSGVVSVLGRFPFGRSASLVLLECGPKVLLIHQQAGKGGAVSTLSEFADRDEVAELRRQLNADERDAKGGFGRDLEQSLGLYDRRGRPKGFTGNEGLPVQGPIETVDLTRRRPRRGVRGN